MGKGGMRARRLWVLYGVRAWRDDTSCGCCVGLVCVEEVLRVVK